MFEVKFNGEIFLFDNFNEIKEFFDEATFAVGADDVEILIRYASE